MSTTCSRSSPAPEHTASAASRPKLPANTLSRRHKIRSSTLSSSWLHSTVARNV